MKQLIERSVLRDRPAKAWKRSLARHLRDWLDEYLEDSAPSARNQDEIAPEETAVNEQPHSALSGPPAHWLERVRAGAPELLLPPEEGGIPWVRTKSDAEKPFYAEPERLSTWPLPSHTAPLPRVVAQAMHAEEKANPVAHMDRTTGVRKQPSAAAALTEPSRAPGSPENRESDAVASTHPARKQPAGVSRHSIDQGLRRITGMVTRKWRRQEESPRLDPKPLASASRPTAATGSREERQREQPRTGQPAKATQSRPTKRAQGLPQARTLLGPQPAAFAPSRSDLRWPDVHSPSRAGQSRPADAPFPNLPGPTPAKHVPWESSASHKAALRTVNTVSSVTASSVAADLWPELPEDLPLQDGDLEHATRQWERAHRVTAEQRGEI